MADCLLCGTDLSRAIEVATTSRWGHPSRRVTCRVCSLVQVSPQPTRSELAHYYASHDYRTEHGPVPITISRHGHAVTVEPDEPGYEDALDQMAAWRAMWACERGGLIEGMRLLEVGSGDGRTLRAHAERGLVVTGIEPDEAEAMRSVERLPQGSRVHATTLEGALDTLEPPYDAVVMHHVLEHFHDPQTVLAQLRSLLTPQGALVVEVPNVLRPGLPLRDHWQHVHLVDFSEHTLVAMLVQQRYRPAWLDATGALRCVARPAEEEGRYGIPYGGQYIEGFLDCAQLVSGGGW